MYLASNLAVLGFKSSSKRDVEEILGISSICYCRNLVQVADITAILFYYLLLPLLRSSIYYYRHLVPVADITATYSR